VPVITIVPVIRTEMVSVVVVIPVVHVTIHITVLTSNLVSRTLSAMQPAVIPAVNEWGVFIKVWVPRISHRKRRWC
jgi:hypothetical protein